MSENDHCDVLIIGGGLAGLSCAVKLSQDRHRVVLLEATDRVGGRLRSDVTEGFTLDHGFQVLLTAYPACRELLDYDALRLRRFDPGALIRCRGDFAILSDPWRRPSQAIATALSRAATVSDKLRIAKVRRASRAGTLQQLYQRPQKTSEQYLRDAGFSESFIDHFFRPFIGGVFLDESLTTPSRMFEFVFRMFADGDVAVPADGMAAIPRQLAERLPRGCLRLQSTVVSREGQTVTLACGHKISADQIVIATESDAAARLLGDPTITTAWNRATTMYYASDRSPDDRRTLMLRGDESGPVQTAVVISNVAPEYAPAGQSLISVSLAVDHEKMDDDIDRIDSLVRRQLQDWFGNSVWQWRLLRVYQIPYGVPRMDLDPIGLPVDVSDSAGCPGMYVCGDHRETPSIQGAMNSGLRVAAAIHSRG